MSRAGLDPLYLVRVRPLELVKPSEEPFLVFDFEATLRMNQVAESIGRAADRCEYELPLLIDRIQRIGVAA